MPIQRMDEWVFAAIPIAEASSNIENTVIGAIVIGVAIAVTKILDSLWSNRRADQKQVKDDERMDKDQVFRLQEGMIKDLLSRIQILEKESKEKDMKVAALEASHRKCQEDHEENKVLIVELQNKILQLESK